VYLQGALLGHGGGAEHGSLYEGGAEGEHVALEALVVGRGDSGAVDQGAPAQRFAHGAGVENGGLHRASVKQHRHHDVGRSHRLLHAVHHHRTSFSAFTAAAAQKRNILY
jgi:hypothetical protein